MISVGCFWVATSFGRSANTSAQLIGVLGAVVGAAGLLGDRLQGRHVGATAEPATAAEPAAAEPAAAAAAEPARCRRRRRRAARACRNGRRGFVRAEADREDANAAARPRTARRRAARSRGCSRRRSGARRCPARSRWRRARAQSAGRWTVLGSVADRRDVRVRLGDRVEPLQHRRADRGAAPGREGRRSRRRAPCGRSSAARPAPRSRRRRRGPSGRPSAGPRRTSRAASCATASRLGSTSVEHIDRETSSARMIDVRAIRDVALHVRPTGGERERDEARQQQGDRKVPLPPRSRRGSTERSRATLE